MKIRNKLVVILFSVTLLFFGIGFLFISIIFLDNIKSYENANMSEKLKSTEIIIANEQKSLESTSLDWADWDDTYYFIQDQTEEYKILNFNIESIQTLKLATAAVYNNKGELLYSVSPVKGFNFFQESKYIEKFTANREIDSSVTGLVMENGRLLIATSLPVTDSQQSKAPNGYLLFVREIDGSFLQNISEILAINLSLDIIADPGLVKTEPYVATGANSIRASTPLYDILGNPVMYLTLQSDRHMYATFTDAAGIISVIYVLSLVLSIFLIFYLISVFLTKPVMRIGKALSKIQPENEKSIELIPIKGNNEISDMAKDINKLLGRVAVNMEKEKKEKNDILFASYHDILTGLYNRRFIEAEFKRLDTKRQYPLSILMGDVNGLKLINDAFGHLEGDRVLRNIANAIKSSCRTEDIVARWGGDEYLALIPQTSENELIEIGKRIRKSCSILSKGDFSISVALGFATKDNPGKTLDDLIKEAENMMYDQKMLEHFSSKSTIIDSIMQTLQIRSHESQEHASRLKRLAMYIADEMNLSEHDRQELSLVAVLHDIGKISIKDSIINKKGPLSESEWKEIKKHPEIGYRILQNLPDLVHISHYVLWHHEKWDGTGYPKGLKGEEIPLLCRIIAVVDAFDAMTNNRSYRDALSPDDACQELIKNSGTQFDPVIVDKFIYSDAIENYYNEENKLAPTGIKKRSFF